MRVGESAEDVVEVLPGELPLEGHGGLLVVALEVEQAALDLLKVREVVGGEHLSLDDREVDLDLVEPAGVRRCVDHMGVRPLAPEPLDARLPAVDGGVVHDPEDAPGAAVGRSRHHVADKAVEVDDAGPWGACAEHLGAAHVPGRDVGERAAAAVFMLDAHGPARRGRGRRVGALPRLDAGLLVGAEDEVLLGQRPPLPAPLVEVEDGPRLVGERRVAGEHPAPVRPGPDGVLVQPPPDGGAADAGDDAAPHGLAPDLGDGEPRQGQPRLAGELAGERLDGDHHVRGGMPGGDLAGARPRVRPCAARRSACAIC